MNKQLRVLAALSAALLILSACANRTTGGEEEAVSAPDGSSATASNPPIEVQMDQIKAAAEPFASAAGEIQEQDYIGRLVRETVARLQQPGMSEFDKAKAAFDYMIETTSLIDPVGLELWRIRGSGEKMPSFVENRSLSVLQFHLGKCEDYAAALTLLLRGMGLEAEYVPGLTYSTQGELVDHAWTVARIDGDWYHLDCQLEQNISRHGSIRYKYFMRGDATMAGSHRWGQNLIDSRLLRAEQNEEIAQSYIPPACPQDYPTPERRPCTLPTAPDMAAIEAAIAAELAEYEESNGPLEPLDLNIIPPVFALEGYGPQD